jgi:hypothetical protein
MPEHQAQWEATAADASGKRASVAYVPEPLSPRANVSSMNRTFTTRCRRRRQRRSVDRLEHRDRYACALDVSEEAERGVQGLAG